MQICQRHWDKMRDAVKDRGMDHLGAQNGQDLQRNMITELEGRGAENDYDPLFDCHNMVVSQALNILGLGLMNPEKNSCPICSILELTETEWINGPADAARSRCEELGLLEKKSEENSK